MAAAYCPAERSGAGLLRLPPRAGAKRSCDTREEGAHCREAGGSANGTKRDGGTTCGMQTNGAPARPAAAGGARRVMTSHDRT